MKNQRKQRQPIRSGALTIVIAFVMILLAALSLLSLVTAHADRTLADRQVLFAQQNAMAERIGQEWLASMDDYLRADGFLPADTEEDGDHYSADLYYTENAYLSIEADADNQGRLTVTRWTMESVQPETESVLPEGVTAITEGADGTYDILPETTVQGQGVE